MKHVIRLIAYLMLFLSTLASLPAQALTLDFVYPEGEGDEQSAKPYLDEFFAYVKNKTGLTLTGTYYNDGDEALDELKAGTTELAIVSPDFLEAHKDELDLVTLLRTIPIYADGPYEKYYILAGENMRPSQYAALRGAVTLYASRAYAPDFIEKLAKDSIDLKNVALSLTTTPTLLTAMKNVGERKDTAFLLLTGYEYSVFERLKATQPAFANLKLVYESPEMPASALVSVKNRPRDPDLAKLKPVLLGMGKDAEGKKVLAKLRLKGFSH